MTRAPVTLIAILALVALTACAPIGLSAPGAGPAAAPPRAPEQPPAVRLVGAIEAEGCELTSANVGAVLLRANLTQGDLATLVPQLADAGRAEVAGSGTIRVLTERCI